jgi:hypothetical protein
VYVYENDKARPASTPGQAAWAMGSVSGINFPSRKVRLFNAAYSPNLVEDFTKIAAPGRRRPDWVVVSRCAPLRSSHKPDARLIAILRLNFSRETSIDCPVSSRTVSKSGRTVLKLGFTMQVAD